MTTKTSLNRRQRPIRRDAPSAPASHSDLLRRLYGDGLIEPGQFDGPYRAFNLPFLGRPDEYDTLEVVAVDAYGHLDRHRRAVERGSDQGDSASAGRSPSME